MKDTLLHCPACRSANLNNSVYCCQCGAAMRKGITGKGIPGSISKTPWITVAVISLILSIVMTSALHFLLPRKTKQPSVTQQEQIDRGGAPASLQEHSSQNGRFLPEDQETATIEQLAVGSVEIINPYGLTIAEFSAVLTSGSWLALPARACLGGDKWFFRSENGKAIPIEGGLWSIGDSIGFWQLAGEKQIQGPSFATWMQERPVRHLSIETGSLSEPITLVPSGMQGAFIYSPLPDRLDPGVFIQNGKVVGWSFGEIKDGAYMWTLGSDTNLLYTNSVDDFYRETFAGGREEYLTIALTRENDSSYQRQLQVFTEAFRHPSRLSPEDTPRYLKTETVYPSITKLVNNIMDQRAYHYVAPLAEEPMLWEINDPELVKNVLLAIQNIYGTGSAVDFAEGQGADLQQESGEGEVDLKRFHLELYLGWIRTLIDNGDTIEARQVYNRAQSRFNESPELNLLAAEMALTDGEWEEAEGLLYREEYPEGLREKRMLLAERVSDLKGQGNKIVISFDADTNEIPVYATINDRHDQEFIVDTGASLVTIPYETVETLGMEDEMSQDQQEVQTAGGLVYASTVTIPSIELQGWVVSDVKALVLDLPDRPGLGLLGLNFLNRFKMDLQADKGILTLEPK